MKKVNAFIERSKDGTYSVYVDLDDNSLSYGIHGNGKTVKAAVEDFKSAYNAMKTFYEEKGKEFSAADFDFKYDLASFLAYYGNVLSLSGLEKITGVNQEQLSRYVTGLRKPSKKTTEKIESRLHHFANELHEVAFI